MRRLLYGSPAAASIAITVALSATAFAADSPASAVHALPASCTTTFTVAQHHRYARRVFQRVHVKQRARRRLARMRHCQKHGMHARRIAERTERRLKKHRSRYLCTQTRAVGCIRAATRIYGGSFRHNMACARSESGLNPRARNAGGSGAAGLFQFLPSTYAATLARMRVGRKSIDSAKWNSRAAAWKFVHDGYGEWGGAGC
jgi:soluble lytic murein transglycosylase-like protein